MGSGAAPRKVKKRLWFSARGGHQEEEQGGVLDPAMAEPSASVSSGASGSTMGATVE
jgi:hypothetical protein